MSVYEVEITQRIIRRVEAKDKNEAYNLANNTDEGNTDVIDSETVGIYEVADEGIRKIQWKKS